MDLFNNPMVNNALKDMTPEQLEEYKRFGENLYGNINFSDNKIINNLPPPLEESVAYIEEGLKSGLMPGDLTEDEVAVLTQAYGEEWYLRYDFVKEDVPELGLSLDTKREIEEAVKTKISEMRKD